MSWPPHGIPAAKWRGYVSRAMTTATLPPTAPGLVTDPHRAFGVEPIALTTAQFAAYRRDGFLIVRGVISPAEIAELREHTELLMQGKLPEQQASTMSTRDTRSDTGTTMQPLEAPPAHLTPEQKADFFLRIHMLHRRLELHERYMLHPRVVDIVSALVGPDVLAMQTMLFLKGPGKPGQGWHQDSYYIPTHPDTLVGAWIAIDDCDEHNGAMWFAKGSGHEPVYPPRDGYGFGQQDLTDSRCVANVSHDNDEVNGLSPIADRYDQVLGTMKAGDVALFNGHVLHRSKRNITTDRFRRSFVSHYCNARSFTQWGADSDVSQGGAPSVDPVTGMTNASHILARGDTHLPFARPRFGTPCAALLTPQQRRAEHTAAYAMHGNPATRLMGCMPAEANRVDDD